LAVLRPCSNPADGGTDGALAGPQEVSLATHALDVLAPDPPIPCDVHVTRDPHGGWQIDAFVDGRVVATRHCDDWHRVERARRTLAQALLPGRPSARVTALAGRR
jgi:hypothetical protein